MKLAIGLVILLSGCASPQAHALATGRANMLHRISLDSHYSREQRRAAAYEAGCWAEEADLVGPAIDGAETWPTQTEIE